MGPDAYEAKMWEECDLLYKEPYVVCPACDATIWVEARGLVTCGACNAQVDAVVEDEET
jgi:hypothetical protein